MPRQGRLVSVLGLMCPSQHTICRAHQKLHNPSAGCRFLENGAGGASREWRVRRFVPLKPTTTLDPSSFSESTVCSLRHKCQDRVRLRLGGDWAGLEGCLRACLADSGACHRLLADRTPAGSAHHLPTPSASAGRGGGGVVSRRAAQAAGK